MDKTLLNKNNSAGRFLRLFNGALHHHPNTAMAEVWRESFFLPSSLNGGELHHEVASLLTAATEELRAMQAHLIDSGLPPNLVYPYIDKARNAVSVSILISTWSSAVQYLTPEALLAFQWFSFHLPEESHAATSDDIENLHQCLQELEALLDSEVLPPGITTFLKNHAAAMHAALRQAPISGVHQLRKAVRATAADAHFERDELRAETADISKQSAIAKAYELFCRSWKKGAEMSGDAEKYAKGAKVLSDAFESVAGLLS